MKYPLKPNHLAKRIDHQKSAASSLPKSLSEKCTQLNKLTQEIKVLLGRGLPEEILKSLWVVKFEDNNLVISVQSQTAANHLKYQSNNLIHILKEQSLTFLELKNIDVIVTHAASIEQFYENKGHSYLVLNQSKSTLNKGSTHIKYGLTQTTKRTITHTFEHVIKDEKLKNALKRLINSN
ncbi:hypothetical protein [Psychrobacter sp.]|uniref:hypothetical protein n=1 Tax=Psychrobacter sp. TaxID=56811 RepID=UPI0025D27608|nr:hypothetical protein [Psychrobacter sp.]